MTHRTLHGFAIDVLENQRRAGKSLLSAVSRGYARAYGRIDKAWAQGLGSGLASGLNESLRDGLIGAEKRISTVAVNGVASIAGYFEQQLDKAYDGATRGLRSDTAHRLYDTRAYGALSKASLPVAQLSLRIASGVADGAERLADRLAVSRPHAQAKAKAQDKVQAQVKTVATKARRAARKVAAPAAKRRRVEAA